MLQNNLLEGPKTRYSAQSEKLFEIFQNEPFWQWFVARSQKCLKTAFWRLQRPHVRSRPKNGSRAMKIRSSGNSFRPEARNLLKRHAGSFQKPDIRSRPKNGSRAMKMTRSGNGFGPGPTNALKRPSGGSKNQIFGPDRKMVRAQ